MESIWEVVLQNGIFAFLFVWLLFYQIKDSSNREKKYIDIINKLSIELDVVKDVKDDVSEIKRKVFFKGRGQDETKA